MKKIASLMFVIVYLLMNSYVMAKDPDETIIKKDKSDDIIINISESETEDVEIVETSANKIDFSPEISEFKGKLPETPSQN